MALDVGMADRRVGSLSVCHIICVRLDGHFQVEDVVDICGERVCLHQKFLDRLLEGVHF